MTMTAVRPTTRLAYVDNLRILLTVLVLAHHCALTYGPLPLWYWTEPSDSASAVALLMLVTVNQLYFMGMFFLLSGLFVPTSVDRKGPGAFARDRLVRLGVPLVGFWLLIRPLASLGSWPERSAQGESFLQFWFTVGDPGPMWFVEVLLVLSLAYALFRALRARRAGAGTNAPTTGAAADRALAGHVPFRAFVVLVLVLAVATFLWRLVVPTGTYWPVVGLPTPAFLPQYVVMFVVGILAARRGALAALTVRQGWVAAAVALVGLGVALGASLPAGGPDAGPVVLLVHALAENVVAVSVIVALTVLFRQRFSGQPAWARFAAQHAFAVYVIHPLVLVAVAALISSWAGPAGAKFLVLLALSVPLCWAGAFALRRIPGVFRVL